MSNWASSIGQVFVDAAARIERTQRVQLQMKQGLHAFLGNQQNVHGQDDGQACVHVVARFARPIFTTCTTVAMLVPTMNSRLRSFS